FVRNLIIKDNASSVTSKTNPCCISSCVFIGVGPDSLLESLEKVKKEQSNQGVKMKNGDDDGEMGDGQLEVIKEGEKLREERMTETPPMV
ncbi:hypothetical protein J0S82_009427, partial [Galemys pyrenaicus]